jgi:hypothetical protein
MVCGAVPFSNRCGKCAQLFASFRGRLSKEYYDRVVSDHLLWRFCRKSKRPDIDGMVMWRYIEQQLRA